MLGQRLQEVRKMSGLLSSEVSYYLDVSLKTYLMMESDDYLVEWDVVTRLCDLYGCKERVFYDSSEKVDCLNLSNVDISDLKRIARIRKLYSFVR